MRPADLCRMVMSSIRDGTTSYGVPIDRDGTYRIEGLAPGQYKVSVMIGEKEVSHDVAR